MVTMRAYRYRAARADGRVISGSVQSAQAADAAALLVDRGLFPLSIEMEQAASPIHRPAPRRDLAILFRSIASLVQVGVPLDTALGASAAVARGRLRPFLDEAMVGLRAGEALAGALNRSPGTIPPLAIGMIQAGERGGRLAQALEQVANQLELEAELVGRVRQALAYPILLAIVGTATVAVISTIVVPRFADLLEGAGQTLPPATRLLLAVSGFVTHAWWIIVLGLVLGLVALREWHRSAAGARRWDRWLLSLPVLGNLRMSLAATRGCRALAGMLDSGLPLLAALDALGPAIGDRELAHRLAAARESVAQGITLTQALERAGVLSGTPLQLIAVGESSGQLAAMSGRAGGLAAQEAERGLRTVVGLLEPALIVTFGGLVAFVASALLQAVYGLRAM